MGKIKEIANGWSNLLISSPKINELSKERMLICEGCDNYSENAKKNGYKTIRIDVHCTKCGCTLAAKTRSEDSRCPINKW
jgi:hypothetical protein